MDEERKIMLLWEAFIEDYKEELPNWPLRFTLIAFWRYCQDGSREVEKFLKEEGHNEFLKSIKF